MHRRRWVNWAAAIFTLWTAFGLFMALQSHYNQQVVGFPIEWNRAFKSEFTYAYLWALLTPLSFWIARRAEAL